MKSPTRISENRFLGTISGSSIRNLLPRTISKLKSNPNPVSYESNDENARPVDPNIHSDQNSLGFTKQSKAKLTVSKSLVSKSEAQDEVVPRVETPEKALVKTGAVSDKNEAVANEVPQKDEMLGDQIRLLKEELVRAKSDGCILEASKSGFFARDSLNQLRVSINRSIALPCIYDDGDNDEEVNVDVDDVMKLNEQLDKFHGSADVSPRDSIRSSFASASCEADLMSDDESYSNDTEQKYVPDKSKKECLEDGGLLTNDSCQLITSRSSVSSCYPSHSSPVLEEPALTESPKIRNNRKSMAASLTFLSRNDNMAESSNLEQLGPNKHIQSSKQCSNPTDSLAVSLHKGLQIIDEHRRSSELNRSSVSFSFEHLTLKPCTTVDKSRLRSEEDRAAIGPDLVCTSCQQKLNQDPIHDGDDNIEGASTKDDLKNACKEQAAKIQQLTLQLEQYQQGNERQVVPYEQPGKIPKYNEDEVVKAAYETKADQGEYGKTHFDLEEKEELLKEIADLKSKLSGATPTKSVDQLRSSLLARSTQLWKSIDCRNDSDDYSLEQERERWTEMESEWISLTDELKFDIEEQRRRAEKFEMELNQEKKSAEELNDALQRAVVGHSRFIEQYTELQEMYNELAEKHRAMMEGIAEIKKAAAKAGTKGRHGKRFAKAFVSELSAIREEKEREREFLKKENKSLKTQLSDTAEAVQAAGELLVRLRESEQTASAAEENFGMVQEENEKLRKKVESLKSKHKTEMAAMKQYMAESKLPGSALQPWYNEEEEEDYSDMGRNNGVAEYDDQAWRAEFGATYEDHHHY